MSPFFVILLFYLSDLFGANSIVWTYPPIQISTSGVDASDPQIGVDLNGNGVAVWIESGLVKASNIPQGGAWSAPVTLSGSGATTPALAVDQSGNATAIWVENGVIQAATQLYGGSWSSETPISSTGASSPQLAVDLSGNVVGVWICNGEVESSTKLLNESWQATPDTLSLAGDSPQIAIGSSIVAVVWHAVNSSIDTIYFAQKSITDTWNAATAVSDPNYSSVNPDIAVDLSGNCAAVWFRYDFLDSAYSNVVAQGSYLPLNGIWDTPTDLSMGGLYDPASLVCHVRFDGQGNAVANWNNSYDGSTFWIEASIKTFGEAWGSSLTLIAQNHYAYAFYLAVDALGHAVTIFMNYDAVSGAIDIQAKKMNIQAYNTAWSLTLAQFSIGNINGFPQNEVIADAQGSVYFAAVWMNYNGANQVVYATTGSVLNYPPPTNLQVNQTVNDFGIFQEYCNTVSWTASLYEETLGYLVFRNGTLISNTPTNLLEITDFNQVANGPVTYGVAAFDDNYEQSTVVYVNYP